MRTTQKMEMSLAAVAMALAGILAVSPVFAVCDGSTGCDTCSSDTSATMTATECYAKLAGQGSGHTDNLMGSLQGVLNAVFAVIGFIAVVMIVYGGIQYTISSGDAGKVKKAKDTILYGIVGLIIALLAAAIVNFVLVNALK